jgi:hypothetical protein
MKVKIDLQLVEPEDENYHLLVQSEFADNSTGCWIIDTGASRTVFDVNLKDKYLQTKNESNQLHTAGISDKPIETVIARIYSFTIGKFKIENMDAALLDLSHINRLYSQTAGNHICGLLGGDFLVRYKAIVDYRKKQLILNVIS